MSFCFHWTWVRCWIVMILQHYFSTMSLPKSLTNGHGISMIHSAGIFGCTSLQMCVGAIARVQWSAAFALGAFVVQSSRGAELWLFSNPWDLASATPPGRSSTVSHRGNCCTKSRAGGAISMITNGDVQRVSIHLSHTVRCFSKSSRMYGRALPYNWKMQEPTVSRCIGSQRYPGLEGSLLPCPIRHVVMDTKIKAFGRTETPMQHRGCWGGGKK